MADRLSDMRVDYTRGELLESDLAQTPLAQFVRWMAEAIAADIAEPNAMVLATADAGGRPSARTVLLKAADERGFAFFTNLGSRKSTELRSNPHASLVFPWVAIQRQVVVIGTVEPIATDEARAYFATRPRGSRLGAWASRQSSVVTREALDQAYADLEQRWPGDDIEMPEFWGGWLVRPSSVEFWQGRSSRLHDRLRFAAADAGPTAALDDASAWRVERLSP